MDWTLQVRGIVGRLFDGVGMKKRVRLGSYAGWRCFGLLPSEAADADGPTKLAFFPGL